MQAYFRAEAYYWLTVNAFNVYTQEPMDAYVWIEGYGGGWGSITVQVPSGSRAVGADDSYYPFYLTGFSDGYGNGESRPIFSDTTITALYDLGG